MIRSAVRWSVAAALLAGACATASAPEHLTATVATADGARIALHRWSTGDRTSMRVLVVPEFGFSPALFAPMCTRLRRHGYDVTLVEGRHASGQGDRGWDGWLLDVARAVVVMRPQRVVAIGLGGAAALELASVPGFPPLVAVNVPATSGGDTHVRSVALTESAFEPAAWLRSEAGHVLLANGRQTSREVHEALVATVRPLPPAFSIELAMRLRRGPRAVPVGPVHVVVSPKGNLVPGEQSMALLDAPGFRGARRLSKVELYPRDFGHLDWLVDDGSLSTVLPAIVDALEDG